MTERFTSACSVSLSLAFHISCNICCFSLHAFVSTLLSFASWRAHVAVASWVCCVPTECSLNTTLHIRQSVLLQVLLYNPDQHRHASPEQRCHEACQAKGKTCAVKGVEPSFPRYSLIGLCHSRHVEANVAVCQGKVESLSPGIFAPESPPPRLRTAPSDRLSPALALLPQE